jgi:protein-lysine N-methyltransferase EEF2KMT
LPKIQANVAGAADAIMLDIEGYVSETNATNLFCVKDSVVYTPYADHCLPGVTRTVVMDLVGYVMKLTMQEKRLSLFDFHTADEVFTTGTMGEITPVTTIDGRVIGKGGSGPITKRIQEEYRKLTELVEVIL